jgi:hypothetical protein
VVTFSVSSFPDYTDHSQPVEVPLIELSDEGDVLKECQRDAHESTSGRKRNEAVN